MFRGQLYGQTIPNEREGRVIELVAQGLKNREVAAIIGMNGWAMAGSGLVRGQMDSPRRAHRKSPKTFRSSRHLS